ncbi:MAG: hypothetical protein A3J93_00120 [Candidatus Magasanikbacteria bacterium RIFOXYC2_FULL_42_28]|uniref:Transglycosylase SLT domain-containing protein n=1 Tax=Candidatus Magasanikbacteria bacterium RIFOXYC2_FULL_42_28 TaxID=1798704 RepID=A0A1F6NW29_9BACT|nr:MAG: hypothetical protein A3J93_00120 [Candidatus Magasanikbacteria bacterium RIFOXYC2_FULL_42_28]
MEINRINKIILVVLFLTQFFWLLPHPATASLTDDQAQLEQQLKEVEAQIADLQKQLGATTKEKNTLANKIKQLQITQQQLTALIKQTSLKINNLSVGIEVAKKDLSAAVKRETRLRIGLAEALRAINRQDENILLNLASARGLSDIFTQIKNSAMLSVNLSDLVKKVKEIQTEISGKKIVLEDQKDDAVNLLKIKATQNESLAASITDQSNLLKITKGQEATYAANLADTKKKAAQIRSRIYELFNTGTQINFGQAVEIATYAGGLTGMRPAFLLAIISQESNLGKNVGTCNRVGDPPEKSWKVIMKPTRDQEPFLKITTELGLDPDVTPVSCPMRNKDGSQLGWGGAMGPAQFIPSTWMGYKDKVATITGKSPANPWDIRDAFIAASVLLKANGANGEDDGDWKAAMRYFSGGTNPAYSFYGDNVIKKTHEYESDIAELKK